MCTILIAAAALRLYQLGSESLWVDEWLTLKNAHGIEAHNRHRPLFYLVLRPWLRFAESDAAMRLPAVFFGVAGIFFLFLVGRMLVDRKAAMVACGLMTIAVPELNHSQEVRMYTMASMLTLASIYFLVRWVKGGRRWMLVISATLSYLTFLTTPTTIFGLLLAGGLAAVVLAYARQWQRAILTLTCYFIAGCAWLPFARYARIALSYGSLSWVPRPAAAAPLWIHGELLSGGLGGIPYVMTPPETMMIVSILAFALVLVALFATPTDKSGGVWSIALWFYTVILVAYLVSILKQSVWVPRYFHFASTALYLLAGSGFVAMLGWRKHFAWAISCPFFGLIAIAGVDFYRSTVREDWRGVADRLMQDARRPDQIVVTPGPSELLKYYYRGPVDICEMEIQWWKLSTKRVEVIDDFMQRIPPHSGGTWIVLREDPRLEKVALFRSLVDYFSKQTKSVRVRVFHSAEGSIEILGIVPSEKTETRLMSIEAKTR